MGVFTRLTDIINANINSMLDKAEDPQKVLRLIIQEMEETLVEVRSSAAKNLADKKGLLRQIRSEESRMNFWQEKAELAVDKGREDLARSALIEKNKCLAQVQQHQQNLAVIDENLQLVQEDSLRLQEKISEARRRQEAFNIREQSATVRLKVREKLDSHNIDQAIVKYEQYQQRIDELEAKVEAYDFTANQDLQSQFAELETNDAIEAELEALKKKAVAA